jgi:cyclomaltodextrinase / maltogenic alpha-amylase / neopullulanase
MTIQTPDWVKDAVFYQIFPDRFARSARTPHPPGLQFKAWGSPPEEQGFQGGDLLGIVDKLDYLQDLGITALYLNPIFSSASNHRYHTFDYMQVDPLLGGNAAFRELLDEAHARDMRVVIDGVFNHASRGFWAFHHILECGGNSPYVDWFIVHDWPLRPYQHDKDHPHNYAAWWDLPALPKFNVDNPGARQYLLDVSRYWIEFGADGWRLDVPDEIKDPEFWRSFRQVVKEANPDAYITGEIWRAAEAWLRGDMFDSVMNYIFSRAALSFFGAETVRTDYKPGGFLLQPLNAGQFGRTIDAMLELYDWEIDLAQLNVLDSHDTARVLWTVDEDESALRLCTLFQMTMPGAPCIYYGSEIGMSGGNDPGCRGAFPWHEERKWNHDLRSFYKRAIAMRHAHPALRLGKFETLYAEGDIYAFARTLENEQIVVIFNVAEECATVDLPLNRLTGMEGVYSAIWGQGSYIAKGGKLVDVSISARDAVVLQKKEDAS